MTRTILAPAPEPSSALRVTLTRQPAEAEVLCHGCFDSPLGPVVALGAGGALWGLGFAAEGTPDAVLADLGARWPRARLVAAPEALAPAIQALRQGQGDKAGGGTVGRQRPQTQRPGGAGETDLIFGGRPDP